MSNINKEITNMLIDQEYFSIDGSGHMGYWAQKRDINDIDIAQCFKDCLAVLDISNNNDPARKMNDMRHAIAKCINDNGIIEPRDNIYRIKRLSEADIAKNAQYSYDYACDILQKRFPAGESAILQDPGLAYWYAVKVLEKPWPEAEPIIATKTSYACHYALEVLKHKFPAAEHAIAQDPWFANQYAREFFNGYWPEYEDGVFGIPHVDVPGALNLK